MEQHRQVYLLCLMFIFKNRHLNARRVQNQRTHTANLFSFTRERYNCVKDRLSSYYKGLGPNLSVIDLKNLSWADYV